MIAADIPTKFSVPFANAPDAGTSRVVPLTTVTAGAASLTKGFTSTNMIPIASGGIPPFGQDFNGLLNQDTAWARWQAAGGPVVYDGTFQTAIGGYPSGATLQSAVTLGKVWISTADNNLTNPDAAGAGWRVFFDVTTINVYAGNPNGHVAGTQGAAPYTAPSVTWDIANGLWWTCTTTGNAAGAVWTQPGGNGASGPNWGGTSTGSANAQVITTPASLQSFPTGTEVTFKAGFTNTTAATLTVGAYGTFNLRKVTIAGPAVLAANDIFTGNTYTGLYDGTNIQIRQSTGTAAAANASSNTGTVAAVSGATVAGNLAKFNDTGGTITEGPAPSNNTDTVLAALHGTFTIGNVAVFNDTSGTIKDGGSYAAPGGNYANAGATIARGSWNVDTSGAPFTLILSATPNDGDAYTFTDVSNSWGTNNLTIGGNGHNIGNVPTNTAATFVANVADQEFSVIYRATGTYWRLV